MIDHPSIAIPSYVDDGPSLDERAIRAVNALHYLNDGRIYGVTESTHRDTAIQFSVVVPYGMNRGWRTMLIAARRFWQITKPLR